MKIFYKRLQRGSKKKTDMDICRTVVARVGRIMNGWIGWTGLDNKLYGANNLGKRFTLHGRPALILSLNFFSMHTRGISQFLKALKTVLAMDIFILSG